VIRKAKLQDAVEFCDVVRKSITELCEQDHHGNDSRLAEWLENKTVENCKDWIADSKTNTFVAVKNGRVVGVSHIGEDGHLYLCYILPNAIGTGLGKQLLLTAENSVQNCGLSQITLESTITAKGFYESHGYQCNGQTKNCLQYVKPIKP
jgi:ribosomal protein S18 acetylase RimI-like enzyme